MTGIETDYLVIGAGASGMAFADELIDGSDAHIVMVDRRHAPGGHWNDAYPFVRLHQPSAYYGVNSRPLGNDAIDEIGPNAGFYERATAAEICDYYQHVLDERLLASGRVRFFGMSDYVADRSNGHRLVSRLTGETIDVRVRRKLVDATYLESSVPSTHSLAFDVEPGVRITSPNELVHLADPGSGYTIVGAGKTAMDTCCWLLDNGVAPEEIRWIRPRDSWTLDRLYWQPQKLLPYIIEGVSLQLAAAAHAEDVPDLLRRLEDCGQFIRLDPDIGPEIFRGAILSEAERENLRRIENVVRLGHITHLGVEKIVMDNGAIPTDGDQMHVDCTARGLNHAPVRPVFTDDTITLQWLQWGALPFSAAMTGFVETAFGDEAKKNEICRPSPPLDSALDWVGALYVSQRSQGIWRTDPDIATWLGRSRLDLARGVGDHLDDPRMQSALARMTTNTEPALANLEVLLQQRS